MTSDKLDRLVQIMSNSDHGGYPWSSVTEAVETLEIIRAIRPELYQHLLRKAQKLQEELSDAKTLVKASPKMTNWLAVIKPGYEDHHLLREFHASLPANTQKALDSFGYVGNLSDHLRRINSEEHRFLENYRRHFFIFQTPAVEGLATEYFKSVPEGSILEIPDQLVFSVVYRRWDGLWLKRHLHGRISRGSINETIQGYEEQWSTDPQKSIMKTINRSKTALESLTEERWLGLGKTRKLPQTYIFIGLETADGKYLVKTSSHGPIGGILSKVYISPSNSAVK